MLCPSIITHVATQGSNIACMSDQVNLTKLCQQLLRAQVLSSQVVSKITILPKPTPTNPNVCFVLGLWQYHELATDTVFP